MSFNKPPPTCPAVDRAAAADWLFTQVYDVFGTGNIRVNEQKARIAANLAAARQKLEAAARARSRDGGHR